MWMGVSPAAPARGQSRPGLLTVLDSKTEAGAGREIDIWPELHDVLASYKAATRYANLTDYVFAITPIAATLHTTQARLAQQRAPSGAGRWVDDGRDLGDAVCGEGAATGVL